ncbi:MAG: CpsD/CapB family tyrosine-protein kinase, partial [Crenarchaeota archaeon]|nr:CpsD/CapB family tyrosine-protein kinase [Thermoproteota archaeon]
MVIIATFSADKGGTGKTTIAIVLAHLFSQEKIPTILIDLSYDNPYLSTVLSLIYNNVKIPTDRGFVNWLQDIAEPEEIVIELNPHLVYVPPGIGNVVIDEVVEEKLTRFLEPIRRSRRIVTILDLPAMLPKTILDREYPALLLGYADTIIAVSDFDLVAMRHILHYAINILPRYYGTNRIIFIVNKCRGAIPQEFLDNIRKHRHINMLALRYVDSGPQPVAISLVRDLKQAFTTEDEYTSF